MKTSVRSKTDTGLGLASPHVATGLLCGGLITIGWIFRNELNLSPADGIGYGLGIFGLTAMTLLLGYSFRKRMKWLRKAGPMRTWFEIHLILGLIGPTAILYHSGFGLASMNSTISLACVLLVSGSGVGGRFLYGQMHRSLAGPRRTVDRYYAQAESSLKAVDPILERLPETRERLEQFGQFARSNAILPLLATRIVTLRPRAWLLQRRVLHDIKRARRPAHVPTEAQHGVPAYVGDLCRGLELRLFEKLFALWHAIHVPLTVILFISASIHIVAVHLY